MASVIFQTRPSLCLFFFLWTLLCHSSVLLVSSQSNQNIETFYPFSPPQPAAPLSPPPVPSPPPPLLSPPPPTGSSSTDSKTIGKAVAITAASTVVVSGLFFFLLRRRAISRRRKAEGGPAPNGILPTVSRDEFTRFDGNIKGLIVDENGLDVLYWRRLQASKSRSPRQRNSFKRLEVVVKSPRDGAEDSPEVEEQPVRIFQEVPLLRGMSSTSELNPSPDHPQTGRTMPPPPPPSGPSPPPPPPPTPAQQNKTPKPPPLPVPPPPPPKPGGMASSMKPPPPPPLMIAGSKAEGSSSGEGGSNQVKLKPLHWDKVNVENRNSMVWNKIEGGSFK